MTNADFLVVGQGVAGSVLAWTLDQRGCTVMLTNAPDRPSASRVAAGIVNPLTGRKLVRTWKADALFPYLHNFYTQAEQKLGVHFFHPLDIYRPYRSEDEKKAYLTYITESGAGQYVKPGTDQELYNQYIENDFGGLTITQAGWLDLPLFLDAIQAYFRNKNQFIEQVVDAQSIQFEADSARWNGANFKKVLFAEGPHSVRNFLFDGLPYNPVKGQILTISVDEYKIPKIVNQGVFILPIDNHILKIGATYTWHDLDWQTTDDGRLFLQNKVRDILKVPYRIINQQAGIRPSTKDRRPFVGLHPDWSSAGIFSGMGTKGVSLSPYLAAQFADHLLNNEELDSETNISRVLSL